MYLHLSRHSPLNSVYTNETGQAMYKVETPKALGSRTSTISCVVPNDVQSHNPEDTRDVFAVLGQVVHNPIRSSVLKFGGDEYETKNYFHKEGLGVYGRHRTFVAPNGHEYTWQLNAFTPELIAKDGRKTVIARFHRKYLGIIGKAHSASLEIFPGGEDMIPTILVTFIYIEKLRKDKERTTQQAAAGGGGGP